MQIMQFVEQVFSQPPKPPHSFNIQLDTDGTGSETAAEFLVIVFTKAMAGLWGEGSGQQMHLGSVQPAHLELMEKYFASFGFRIYLDIEEDQPFEPPRFITCGPQLRDVVLHKWADGKLYRLFFDFLPMPDVKPQ